MMLSAVIVSLALGMFLYLMMFTSRPLLSKFTPRSGFRETSTSLEDEKKLKTHVRETLPSDKTLQDRNPLVLDVDGVRSFSKGNMKDFHVTVICALSNPNVITYVVLNVEYDPVTEKYTTLAVKIMDASPMNYMPGPPQTPEYYPVENPVKQTHDFMVSSPLML